MAYEHVFGCQTCRDLVVIKTKNADYDNPPLPSLFHYELAQYAESKKPVHERALLPLAVRNCSGRMLWKSSDLLVVVAAVPAPRTVLDHSSEFTHGQQAFGVNTICAALDVSTGAVKKGVNAHGTARAALHLTLQQTLDRVERLEKGWSTANCAEIHAVDKLLKAGSLALNIRVHSRDAYGNPKPPCENCQGWLAQVGDGSFKMRLA